MRLIVAKQQRVPKAHQSMVTAPLRSEFAQESAEEIYSH